MTIELTMAGPSANNTFVMEVFAVASYNSTYTLDTSPSSNPLYLVQTNDMPKINSTNPQTIPVDPKWYMTAWSVDQDGILAQTRSATIGVLRGFKAGFEKSYFNQTSLHEDSPADNVSSVIIVTVPTEIPPADTSIHQLQRRDPMNTEVKTTFVAAPPTSSFYSISATNTAATTYATGTSNYAPTISFWYPTSIITPDSDEQSEIPVDAFDYYKDDPSDKYFDSLLGFLVLSYLQALSMVDYSKDVIGAVNETTPGHEHPKLYYYAVVHVWMYGINSRTSHLGVIVVCAGIACVICSRVLGIVLRRRQHSLTDIIVAAIKHQHEGELANLSGDSEHAARVRYQVQDGNTDGMIRFHHVD